MAMADLDPDLSSVPTPPVGPHPAQRLSWFDRLGGVVARVPLSEWVLFPLLLALIGVLSQVPTWLDGSVPWGRFEAQHLLIAVWLVFPVALKLHLDRLARRSFDQLELWLGMESETAAGLRARLTQLPARPAFLAGVLGALSFWLLYLLSPGLFAAVRSSLLNAAISLALLTLNFALVAAMIYHTFHQLRAVSEISASARRIDLLHLDPFYAFSSLTAHTGISWMIVLYVSVAATPGALASPLALGLIVLQAAAVLAAFGLPLLGIHRRLSEEKSRLLSEVALRLRRAIAELHHRTDQMELAEMDAIHKMILSLIAERELLQKTPTWPWQPGTPVAVITALLLPVGLFLVQRLLERMIGI
jgi:hypothetical protein